MAFHPSYINHFLTPSWTWGVLAVVLLTQYLQALSLKCSNPEKELQENLDAFTGDWNWSYYKHTSNGINLIKEYKASFFSSGHFKEFTNHSSSLKAKIQGFIRNLRHVKGKLSKSNFSCFQTLWSFQWKNTLCVHTYNGTIIKLKAIYKGEENYCS